MHAEDYRTILHEINGQKVNVTSYKIGEQFYCHVTNVDPDATISRAEAATREDAEKAAMEKAAARLKPR
ncbi:MAG: hypothetical protein ONB46_23735 [candidate division KSB1 bacterium]|nr:hypothetical protein [candidate division KSB1 bacterium]MDZ7368893.1 hypothetical protein [candidate division KSB1 bacterium]MDZ7406881.1 hypothetical protein [candidate division KSB1 bacterium]